MFRPATPVSAVPVLPATSTPEIWAAVPVPAETASTIISVSAWAVVGFITVPTSFGSWRSTTFPPGARTSSTRYGCMSTPPLAIADAIMAIWSGVIPSRSCPKASLPGSASKSCFGKNSRPCS